VAFGIYRHQAKPFDAARQSAVSVIARDTGAVIEVRTGSQGGSGGEKEIIASYLLIASLSYALCPPGDSRPLFATIILDEAFSKNSHAVASRIIARVALWEDVPAGLGDIRRSRARARLRRSTVENLAAAGFKQAQLVDRDEDFGGLALRP
jgi:hypothetical protein